METGRGWGRWCGSWMYVDGDGVSFEDGVDREGVRSWMGIYGEWRMDVLDESRMEERRIGRIANGGKTYWTNREWRKPQTFSLRCMH